MMMTRKTPCTLVEKVGRITYPGGYPSDQSFYTVIVRPDNDDDYVQAIVRHRLYSHAQPGDRLTLKRAWYLGTPRVHPLQVTATVDENNQPSAQAPLPPPAHAPDKPEGSSPGKAARHVPCTVVSKEGQRWYGSSLDYTLMVRPDGENTDVVAVTPLRKLYDSAEPGARLMLLRGWTHPWPLVKPLR